jgi:hypothetical protein
LLSKPQPQHDYLYWEFFGRGFKRALRIGKFKVIQNGINSPFELYNLENDLGEKYDIAKKHPEVITRVKTILKDVRTESKIWKIPDVKDSL